MKNPVLFAALAAAVLLFGCVSPQPPGLQNQSNESLASATPTGQLQIIVKDVGLPEVKFLQPTIKQIRLKELTKGWVTVFSDTGKTVKLTTDGAEIVLDNVTLAAGTYVGTELTLGGLRVLVDANRDGDTLDTNVEIILTEAEWAQVQASNAALAERRRELGLPPIPTPTAPPGFSMPTPPPAPAQPPAPTPPPKPSGPAMTQGADTVYFQEPSPSKPPKPSPPSMPTPPPAPSQPPQPASGEKPSEPPWIIHKDGLVYTSNFIDENFAADVSNLVPLWNEDLAYSGSGGRIVYDFSFQPLEPKADQIVVNVTAER